MLIATAGHIDHGKTSLVRALTSVETDRLPEEKARGITIDLGFAYWRPDGDAVIGFVDVPGHERYVRNMLAGVSGITFALIVIAADDGIMPQTVEHVQILDLLGIRRGGVVITKCDKASPGRIAQTRTDAQQLLVSTGLAAAPVFEVSALSGQGLDALSSHLRAEAARPQPESFGAFRMAVDRAFSVSGAGTVATGTVTGGTLSMGERLAISPGGSEARIRGLQSAGRSVDQVRTGQRCAVNLGGIEVDHLHRGDWLLAPAMHEPTTRIEARVQVLPSRDKPLRHDTALHLHIGTADIPARMLSRRQSPVRPGEDQLVTFVLEHPTSAVNGARFVLRDQSGRELLGGGRIVDPLPPARRRRDEARAVITAALELHHAPASLAALLEIPGHELDRAWFERCFNLPPEAAAGLYDQAGAVVVGKGRSRIVSADRLASCEQEIVRLLAAFHAAQPDVGGLPMRAVKQQMCPAPSEEFLNWLVRDMANRQQLILNGSLVRLPGHSPAFSEAELAMWRAMGDWLGDQAPRTVTPAELAAELRTSEGAVRAMLFRRRVSGDLWSISEGRFMLRNHVAMLAASAAALAAGDPAGFTAARFRDGTGIGRNHVIRLLEFLDGIGVTARRGDRRIVRTDFEAIVGAAAPFLPGVS